MSWAKIHGKLRSRKGAVVQHRAPEDVQKAGGNPLSGRIIDEVWVDPVLNDSPARASTGPNDWGDYSFCAQLVNSMGFRR